MYKELNFLYFVTSCTGDFILFYFVYFVLFRVHNQQCARVTPGSTLHESVLVTLRKPYGILGAKTGLSASKTNTLPTVLYSYTSKSKRDLNQCPPQNRNQNPKASVRLPSGREHCTLKLLGAVAVPQKQQSQIPLLLTTKFSRKIYQGLFCVRQ